MTRTEAVRWIKSRGNRFFGIEFIKRTDCTRRTMLCRLGVKKHLRGGPPAYDFAEKKLIPVFDIHKKGYRSIPTEAITRLHVENGWTEVGTDLVLVPKEVSRGT